ncbi:hypothetical protein D3C79_780410 [compost metagenome]
MACASSSVRRTRPLAFSPSAAKATPKNSENTTICRISLLAKASANDLGTKWVTKALRVKAEVCSEVGSLTSGSGSARCSPGCSMLAIIRPTASDSSEAVKNHIMALPNTLPTAPASPIWAMPTTRVENTSGPISILISLRNTSDITEM